MGNVCTVGGQYFWTKEVRAFGHLRNWARNVRVNVHLDLVISTDHNQELFTLTQVTTMGATTGQDPTSLYFIKHTIQKKIVLFDCTAAATQAYLQPTPIQWSSELEQESEQQFLSFTLMTAILARFVIYREPFIQKHNALVFACLSATQNALHDYHHLWQIVLDYVDYKYKKHQKFYLKIHFLSI
jgi:hypothetical protein